MDGNVLSSPIKLDSDKWIERFARFGFSAKGVVYVLLGIIVLMAALNISNHKADKQGVLDLLFAQPFGQILVGIVVIGLIGYVVWRFTEAINDPYHEGSEAKGILKRIGYAISGLVYAGLAISAIRMLVGYSNKSSNNRQSMAAKLLEYDAGPILLMLIGFILLIVAGNQFYRAYKAKFNKKLNVNRLGSNERTWINRIGKIGYTARGIVLLIIGFFVVQAGIQHDPNEVKGSKDAFNLIEQNYGSWVLVVVALGVVAYGLFMFVKAKYYQVKVS